jgi:phospholipid N-methyltransferase
MNDSYAMLKTLRGLGTREVQAQARSVPALEPSLAERLLFFSTFLRQPGRVGALAPSSPWLARAMLEGCDLKHADTVVELGPGTGSFTELILRRIGEDTTFLALELAPEHTRNLRRRFPGLLVFNDSAERLDCYLARHGKPRVDCLISGLPWANMRPTVQDRLADAIFDCLAPNGVFTAFAYVHASWLPTARHFRRRLEQRFAQVKLSPVIWRNVPPAFVYRCRRPI